MYRFESSWANTTDSAKYCCNWLISAGDRHNWTDPQLSSDEIGLSPISRPTLTLTIATSSPGSTSRHILESSDYSLSVTVMMIHRCVGRSEFSSAGFCVHRRCLHLQGNLLPDSGDSRRAADQAVRPIFCQYVPDGRGQIAPF